MRGSYVYVLCRAVTLTVVIYAVLYCAVDTLDVLAIRSAGLLCKIVHNELPNLSLLRSFLTVRNIIDNIISVYVIVDKKSNYLMKGNFNGTVRTVRFASFHERYHQ